jgi:hypothetical protein
MQDELIDIYGDYEILMEDDELSGSELAFMVGYDAALEET